MTTANENIAVAATILDQLSHAPEGKGWGRLMAMMSIRNRRLRQAKRPVQLFAGCKKYNKAPDQSSTATTCTTCSFVPARNPSTKNIVMRLLGIFDDQLAEQFTYVTGLDTRL